MEDHLSAMAAKGWRLEKAGNTFWKYRRAEPAQVRYVDDTTFTITLYSPKPTLL